MVRREEIKVRTNPLKTDTETVALDVEETRNGVIMREEAGKKYALKWTARDPENSEFEAFYFMNRAKDWRDFTGALKKYGGSTQNFVYADVKGNIGWYAAGRIPIRRAGDGSMPYDGATTDGDWTGFIPFEELPNLYNPTEGFIVTANQRIVGTAYKYQQVSRDAAMPWRVAADIRSVEREHEDHDGCGPRCAVRYGKYAGFDAGGGDRRICRARRPNRWPCLRVGTGG